MGRKLLLIILLLTAGFFRLRAQDIPVSVLDGPILKVDTLSKKLPLDFPLITDPIEPSIRMPDYLSLPSEFETKEQRAAKANTRAARGVKSSVDENLKWYKPPVLSSAQKALLTVGRLFLTNPNGFQKGTVPMLNSSFPYIFAVTPGGAPCESPYTPDRFPQAVKMEYDMATGTYKPVMVDWKQYQKDLKKAGFNAPLYDNAPIPKVPLAPGDRVVH